jgi:hypothetical protein
MTTIKVYESDGSDGYSEGTFGFTVTMTTETGRELASGDGGYPNREMARDHAEAMARRAEETWQ